MGLRQFRFQCSVIHPARVGGSVFESLYFRMKFLLSHPSLAKKKKKPRRPRRDRRERKKKRREKGGEEKEDSALCEEMLVSMATRRHVLMCMMTSRLHIVLAAATLLLLILHLLLLRLLAVRLPPRGTCCSHMSGLQEEFCVGNVSQTREKRLTHFLSLNTAQGPGGGCQLNLRHQPARTAQTYCISRVFICFHGPDADHLPSFLQLKQNSK